MEKFIMESPADLADAAEKILDLAGERKIIAFYGGMGAGKTTLISEIADQLGVIDEVSSPTFAIVNQYLTSQGDTIFHFDFYRLDKPEEAFDLGYEEYFGDGSICLIEWPEKIEQLLPEDTMKVYISVSEDDGHRELIIC